MLAIASNSAVKSALSRTNHFGIIRVIAAVRSLDQTAADEIGAQP
jgi:hypothetical protein